MSNAALERVAWVLIYSGLLFACLGLFLMRRDTLLGGAFVAVGTLDAAVGVVLIWLRARRQAGPGLRPSTRQPH
jgi:hypothetical protein